MAPGVRTIRATVGPAEARQRRTWRQQRHQALPPPQPAAVVAAITILEVKAGLRPARQLERLCHHSLWPALHTLPDPPSDHPIPVVPRPRAIALRQPIPGLVDVAVVIEFAGRPHALGLRLDGARGYWELVEFDYSTGPTRELPAPGQGPGVPRPLEAGAPHPRRREQARLWRRDLPGERRPLDGPGIELE